MGYINKDRNKLLAASLVGLIIIGTALLLLITSGPKPGSDAEAANELLQNNIILDSIDSIDVSSPQSAEQHKTISEQLGKSFENIEKLMPALEEEQSQEISRIISIRKEVYKTYSSNADSFFKILSYNPSDDLQLKSATKSRAAAASDGIGSLLNKTIAQNEVSLKPGNVKLSDAARSSLEESRNCFAQLFKGSVGSSRCIKSYQATRIILNSELQNLWQAEEVMDTTARSQALIDQLSRVP